MAPPVLCLFIFKGVIGAERFLNAFVLPRSLGLGEELGLQLVVEAWRIEMMSHLLEIAEVRRMITRLTLVVRI